MSMWIRHSLMVLASTIAVGSTHAASLKEQPPEGVKLTGTWQLDQDRSDDPVEQMKKAEKAEIAKRRREIEDRNRSTSDPFGRDDYDGPWDGSMPGDRHRRRDPFPDRTEGGVMVDPTGNGSIDVSWGKARSGSLSDEFLLALDPNPATLTIADWGRRVSVSEDKLETECIAGEVRPIADAFGDGERECGWHGRAWVIETTRTERFKRTDRFELSKNGKVLKYTSSASGARIPSIKVSRTYTLAAVAPK
jgi:hypothetical protein